MTVNTSLHPAAPLDRPTKLTTAALIVAVVGLTMTIPVDKVGPVGFFFGVVLPLLLVLLAYALSPRAYRLLPDQRLQIVRRVLWPKTFRISAADHTSALFGLDGARLAGSGGIFGWYGVFWRRGSGKFRAYVTDRAQLVVCDGPDGVIILSPADRDLFLTAAAALGSTPAARNGAGDTTGGTA